MLSRGVVLVERRRGIEESSLSRAVRHDEQSHGHINGASRHQPEGNNQTSRQWRHHGESPALPVRALLESRVSLASPPHIFYILSCKRYVSFELTYSLELK